MTMHMPDILRGKDYIPGLVPYVGIAPFFSIGPGGNDAQWPSQFQYGVVVTGSGLGHLAHREKDLAEPKAQKFQPAFQPVVGASYAYLEELGGSCR